MWTLNGWKFKVWTIDVRETDPGLCSFDGVHPLNQYLHCSRDLVEVLLGQGHFGCCYFYLSKVTRRLKNEQICWEDAVKIQSDGGSRMWLLTIVLKRTTLIVMIINVAWFELLASPPIVNCTENRILLLRKWTQTRIKVLNANEIR